MNNFKRFVLLGLVASTSVLGATEIADVVAAAKTFMAKQAELDKIDQYQKFRTAKKSYKQAVATYARDHQDLTELKAAIEAAGVNPYKVQYWVQKDIEVSSAIVTKETVVSLAVAFAKAFETVNAVDAYKVVKAEGKKPFKKVYRAFMTDHADQFDALKQEVHKQVGDKAAKKLVEWKAKQERKAREASAKDPQSKL